MRTITGQVVQLQLPPGAALPAGATLISSVCPPPVTTPTVTVPTTSTPSTTTTTTTGSQTTTTGGSGKKSQTTTSTTPTTTPTTTAPKPSSPGKSQQPSNHPSPAGTVGSHGSGKSSGKNKQKKPAKSSNPPQRTSSGVPTPSNPSFSFALPGAAPIGVPNFFIDSFRIPPFLLPIYQAAGIQYNVPWQILAAINEIETDYGRNLSVSTAGAVGWMQFI
ncbi:MAG TPA: hypothetical protein VGN29_17685, partial [Solirubrobacteraceae bacterium]|nr:hypothetical protein [Solirubrobacteraceae bacterium]